MQSLCNSMWSPGPSHHVVRESLSNGKTSRKQSLGRGKEGVKCLHAVSRPHPFHILHAQGTGVAVFNEKRADIDANTHSTLHQP